MNLSLKMKRKIMALSDALGYDVVRDGSLLGCRLTRRERLGYNRRDDWKRFLPRNGRHTIFDVGADVGQTALTFIEAFPFARIFSFEPDPESYKKLCQNTRKCRNITAINAALGERDEQAVLHINNFRQANSLLENAPDCSRYVTGTQMEHKDDITVSLMRLDSFCRDADVPRIDLLKIDAQGYELHILDGARHLIEEKRLPLVYLEVCFVEYYKDQPLFHHVYDFMFERNYKLVGLYHSYCPPEKYLLYSDALFVLDTN
jgi:FkbM family methyltransferase